MTLHPSHEQLLYFTIFRNLLSASERVWTWSCTPREMLTVILGRVEHFGGLDLILTNQSTVFRWICTNESAPLWSQEADRLESQLYVQLGHSRGQKYFQVSKIFLKYFQVSKIFLKYFQVSKIFLKYFPFLRADPVSWDHQAPWQQILLTRLTRWESASLVMPMMRTSQRRESQYWRRAQTWGTGFVRMPRLARITCSVVVSTRIPCLSVMVLTSRWRVEHSLLSRCISYP